MNSILGSRTEAVAYSLSAMLLGTVAPNHRSKQPNNRTTHVRQISLQTNVKEQGDCITLARAKRSHGMEGGGTGTTRTSSLLVLEVDLPPQLAHLVAELGGDGLALLERRPDAALLLEQRPLGGLAALGVQVLPPVAHTPPYHLRFPPPPQRLRRARLGKTLGVGFFSGVGVGGGAGGRRSST